MTYKTDYVRFDSSTMMTIDGTECLWCENIV